MKVFCVLALFAASAVQAQIDLPPGVQIENLLKQSCIDYDKGKVSAATAGGDCSEVANYDIKDGPWDGKGLMDKFKKLIKGVGCFFQANNVRDENGGIKIDELKKAVLTVATSPEKGNAYDAIIKDCSKEYPATVPTSQQLQLLSCVLSTVQEKGICKP